MERLNREGYLPTSYDSLAEWAVEFGLSMADARRRHAQAVIIATILTVEPLRRALVLKGGNALDFAWTFNRTSHDLNFSFDQGADAFAPVTADMLYILLRHGLLNEHDLITPYQDRRASLRLRFVRAQPRKPGSTFITYRAGITYVFPDQPRYFDHLQGRSFGSRTQHIPVEISINEPICADMGVNFAIDHHRNLLRVSTPSDIVAEKLRALLQQPIRNRHRPQDVLDLAILLSHDIGFTSWWSTTVDYADHYAFMARAHVMGIEREAADPDATPGAQSSDLVRARSEAGFAEQRLGEAEAELNSALDRAAIASYLQIKAAARNVPVSKAAFRDPEIRARAAEGYDQLEQTARDVFIPFETAFEAVLAFTDALAIPD